MRKYVHGSWVFAARVCCTDHLYDVEEVCTASPISQPEVCVNALPINVVKRGRSQYIVQVCAIVTPSKSTPCLSVDSQLFSQQSIPWCSGMPITQIPSATLSRKNGRLHILE